MSEARIKTLNLINSLLTQHKQVRPGVADIIACEIDNYIDKLLERQVEACWKAVEQYVWNEFWLFAKEAVHNARPVEMEDE